MNRPFNVDEMRRIIEQLREPIAEPKPKSEPVRATPRTGRDAQISNQLTDQARSVRRQLVASCDLTLLPTLARPPADAIEALKAWNVVRSMAVQ